MKTIASLPLDQIQPGMKVAQPLNDDGGRVLVPAGVEVSEGMLASLLRRDVAALTVEIEVEEEPAAREAHRAKLVGQLDHLFRQAGEAPETRLIYQAVLDFRMEHRS